MNEARDVRNVRNAAARIRKPCIRAARLLIAITALTVCAACETTASSVAIATDQTEEWRWANTIDHRRLPLLDEPRWSSLGELALADEATGLQWRIPSKMKIQGDVSFAQAEQYCQGIMAPAQLWHVPTRQQLLTLLNYKYRAPIAGTDMLTGLREAYYWTRTLSVPDSTDTALWAISFTDGKQSAFEPKRTAGVLCVSQDPHEPVAHYANHGTTIDDNATGLSWHKQTTRVDSNSDNIAGALADACATSTLAGKRWRMPTQTELSSLLDASHSRPYLDPLFEGERFLISSTSALPGDGQTMHAVNFDSGELSTSQSHDTRCVSQGSGSAGNDRIHRGTVNISNALDLQQFSAGQYKRIEGSLVINIGIRNSDANVDVGAVLLPFLETVTGDIGLSINPKMRIVAMPNLTSIGGSLALSGNTALEQLVFPRLESIGASLAMVDNPMLGRDQIPENGTKNTAPFDFRALRSVRGDMLIQRNKTLKVFAIDLLQTIGKQLAIEDNASLATFRLGALRSVGGDFSLNSNPALAGSPQLFMLKSIGSSLTINGNPKLAGMNQKIDSIGKEMRVTFNTSLCENKLTDPILSNAWGSGGFPPEIDIANNASDPECRSVCPSNNVCKIPH